MKTYREQKELLKQARQQRVQRLYRAVKNRQKRDRYIKREFERVIEAFRLLFIVLLSPVIIPFLILPVILLFICMVGMLLYEIVKGVLRLLMYPFFAHMKKIN